MKVKFERIYGNFKIGDIGEISDKEELEYLKNTGTAVVIEEFETSETDEDENQNENQNENETQEEKVEKTQEENSRKKTGKDNKK